MQRDTVGGKIEFVPVPIEECQLTDTSYEILVFDPNDSTFKAYAGIPRPARVCIVGDSVHTHG